MMKKVSLDDRTSVFGNQKKTRQRPLIFSYDYSTIVKETEENARKRKSVAIKKDMTEIKCKKNEMKKERSMATDLKQIRINKWCGGYDPRMIYEPQEEEYQLAILASPVRRVVRDTNKNKKVHFRKVIDEVIPEKKVKKVKRNLFGFFTKPSK